MNTEEMLEFLLSNSVHIKSEVTGLCMIADEMYILGGEFVVYKPGKDLEDVYRGTDFELAMKYMDGDEE